MRCRACHHHWHLLCLSTLAGPSRVVSTVQQGRPLVAFHQHVSCWRYTTTCSSGEFSYGHPPALAALTPITISVPRAWHLRRTRAGTPVPPCHNLPTLRATSISRSISGTAPRVHAGSTSSAPVRAMSMRDPARHDYPRAAAGRSSSPRVHLLGPRFPHGLGDTRTQTSCALRN